MEIRMSAQCSIEREKKRAAWMIFMGLVTAVLGAFLVVYPLFTAKLTTVLLGWVLIFVAIAEFTFAVHSRQPGSFFVKLLSSGIFAVIGAWLALSSMEGVEALTGLLGTMLLVQAGLAAVTAYQIRPAAGWPWHLVEAGSSFLLGLLILVEWPSSSVWAIGTLVGLAVLMSGIVKIVVAARTPTEASRFGHLFSHGEDMGSEKSKTQRSVS
jgi:uncharacterized membrane protein HdeD (DUF308 family)